MSGKNEEYEHISHCFKPVYDENSKVLILGSFPSVKSRIQGFYYGHPQNRFWKVLPMIMGYDVDYLKHAEVRDKISFLLKNNIAVWDVIESCDIIGSSDSSIKNVIPADIEGIIKQTEITAIFTNGKLAGRLYDKYFGEKIKINHLTLPSTSPANAAYNMEKLTKIWSVVSQRIALKQD
ncbi:MAG: DNA-deoxyinosine glycosylase [Lachnospiraceae bacterium]|nr:DNA-deoxyinosine glycosylase [Lachnospiraceae bacterium]